MKALRELCRTGLRLAEENIRFKISRREVYDDFCRALHATPDAIERAEAIEKAAREVVRDACPTMGTRKFVTVPGARIDVLRAALSKGERDDGA